jgi:hypothetical protein
MQLSAIPAPSTAAPIARADHPGTLLNRLFGDDGLTFRDVLDLVNPLQHIPVVGNLYRELTQDTIDPAVRVAGGALFGGPFGALFATGSMLLQHAAAPGAPAAPRDGATEAAGDQRSAPAPAPPPEAPRGGWLVSAAVTGRIGAFAPVRADATAATDMALAATPRPSRHPGGWLVEQAYAEASLTQARDARLRATA